MARLTCFGFGSSAANGIATSSASHATHARYLFFMIAPASFLSHPRMRAMLLYRASDEDEQVGGARRDRHPGFARCGAEPAHSGRLLHAPGEPQRGEGGRVRLRRAGDGGEGGGVGARAL